MKPGVGRIVHFYTFDPKKQFNAQGEGPYAAVITQSSGPYSNLLIFPPFAEPYHQGSVLHQDDMHAHGPSAHYWIEPLRT